MSRSCLFSIALVCLLVCQPLDAKPGRGGGGPKRGGGSKIFRGGGGRKSISPGGGRKSISPQQKSVGGGRKIQSPSGNGKPDLTTKGQGNGKPDLTSKGQGNGKPDLTSKGQGQGKPGFDTKGRGNGQTAEKLTGRNQAVNVQRANEERKLTHRQATAQKLREISDRNGNENLKNAADRMDQKALDHYEKRQAKIDQLAQKANGPLDANQLSDPLDQPLTDQQIANLNDPVLQQNHRLLNEERKLQHQLSVAQQLRDISAQNGNANLIRTAEQMESMAANRYASQMTKILGPAASLPGISPATSLPGINPAAAPLIPTAPAPVPQP